MPRNVKDFYQQYYNTLLGATILKVAIVEDSEGSLWPTIWARLPDNTTAKVEVSCDEEGNAPGFLFGLKTPEPVTAE